MACYDPRDEGRERPKRNRGTTTSPSLLSGICLFRTHPWILHDIRHKGLLLIQINLPNEPRGLAKIAGEVLCNKYRIAIFSINRTWNAPTYIILNPLGAIATGTNRRAESQKPDNGSE